MKPNPLADLVARRRPGKPRIRGLTMVADWGLGLGEQQDFLSVASPFTDLAKIAVGISALFASDVLSEKIETYATNDILPFPGGQFLEYAVLRDRADAYMRACVEAGFPCVEVSDNLLEIDLDDKIALILRAKGEYGLRVLGEVGRKEGRGSSRDLATDAAECLRAGAERVFLEAADFFVGAIDEVGLNRIIKRCGMDKLIFELPGPWIQGVTLSDIHQITRWLLDRFGADANIANVSPADVLKVEALRLGIGVNAGG
jgi:phosphosulfolactate synthase